MLLVSFEVEGLEIFYFDREPQQNIYIWIYIEYKGNEYAPQTTLYKSKPLYFPHFFLGFEKSSNYTFR